MPRTAYASDNRRWAAQVSVGPIDASWNVPPGGAFETARTVLERTAPELIVSKQRLAKIEGIELVRIKREHRDQSLCFSSRPFVLCGLPVRRPPAGELLYERRNGQFTLQVAGHPEFGVPFGQDRIVPIFLATLAVRQKSQTIRFKTAAEMLETFGMHKGGKEYRRLVAAFERSHNFLWSRLAHREGEGRSTLALQLLARGSDLV